jgi:hypothetical protein
MRKPFQTQLGHRRRQEAFFWKESLSFGVVNLLTTAAQWVRGRQRLVLDPNK